MFFEPENTLLLTYTAAQQYANGSVVARLAMATSEDGGLNWKRLGVVFPQIPYSKSGAGEKRAALLSFCHNLFYYFFFIFDISVS